MLPIYMALIDDEEDKSDFENIVNMNENYIVKPLKFLIHTNWQKKPFGRLFTG